MHDTTPLDYLAAFAVVFLAGVGVGAYLMLNR
jgi:hypothetical protein